MQPKQFFCKNTIRKWILHVLMGRFEQMSISFGFALVFSIQTPKISSFIIDIARNACYMQSRGDGNCWQTFRKQFWMLNENYKF